MESLPLWHLHPTGANERQRLIGENRQEGPQWLLSTLLARPGFSPCPEKFEIVPYEIGMDHWTEGYFTE